MNKLLPNTEINQDQQETIDTLLISSDENNSVEDSLIKLQEVFNNGSTLQEEDESNK